MRLIIKKIETKKKSAKFIFMSHIRQMGCYSAENLELSKQIYSQQCYLKVFYLIIIQLLINFF